jgi:NADH dehydrogenase/NADH:ubiquinone oxidoreductase subunit G
MVSASEDEMLLAVIKREGIDVPSTCDHKAVEPYGACRLCTVEITRTEWDGWKKHVTSCLYPVEEGLIVSTHTEEVIKMRKTILDLYLARSPKAEFVQNLAAQYGVMQTSFETVPDGDDCILCALCTRVCDAMGFHAIATVNRGHGKEVAPPLGEAPPDCVGCLACAQVCPTKFIKFTDDGDSRTIWGKKFELIACEESGKPTITRAFADHLSAKRDIPEEYFKVDDETHRNELARTMGKIAGWEKPEEQS